MTKEEKQLLLKDLCARLPYSTLCYCKWTKDAPNGTSGCIQEVSTYLLEELMIIDDQNYECQICEIKPYLRPMSSMTSKEWVEFCDCSLKDEASWVITMNRQKLIPVQNREDYLNSKHFDYRGLIEKGLALEAPEGMYKIN